MAETTITITGLVELRQRFAAFPDKYNKSLQKTMQAVLLKVWELVPAYPSPPPNSSYRRTGTLGRTLGVSAGGGRAGRPDIYEKRQAGGYHEARFGTRLEYARYVIGDKSSEQAWMHEGRWWTIPQDLFEKVREPIEKLFEIATEEMAKWLDGKGL